ncbi:hypothetical protein B0F90DRAFT_1741194 [Multifurca ochricompacta]|uniref:Uncharacterized protein n=1 Tax=Multifurca ochricompacta TaxID=376703 RepID=A0AAD4M0T0_9AGAM|nr:hypothetical protein B0F90DRAFT_1741194 [Multifurca ochricompacta]
MIRDRVTNLLYGALQGRDTICVCVTCPCGGFVFSNANDPDRPMCQHFHHHHQRTPEHWDIPSHIITHHASRITHPHHNLLAFVVLSCFVVLL